MQPYQIAPLDESKIKQTRQTLGTRLCLCLTKKSTAVLPQRLKIQQHENSTIALFVRFVRGSIITTTILYINMIKYVETIFYVITGYGNTQAPGSFVFSLRNKENLPPFKAPLKDQNDGNAIFPYPDYGPTFGRGRDLHISNNAASNTKSGTSFGSYYQPPPGVKTPYTVMAGTRYFSPTEVEVFHLVQN